MVMASIAAQPINWILEITFRVGGVLGPDLLQRLNLAGVDVSVDVEKVMRSSHFIPSDARIVSLVATTPRVLGFSDATLVDSEVFAQHEEWGLGLCPSDVAPHLCPAFPVLAHRVWPAGDAALQIASLPISSPGRYCSITMGLEWSEGGKITLVSYGYPSSLGLDEAVVFECPVSTVR